MKGCLSTFLPLLASICLALPARDAAVSRSAGFAQDQIVSLTIDARNQGAVISPLLFGHNLEHTRRAIWQGISAQMIANRKFAAVENGLPKRWTTTSGGGRVVTDDQVTYAGKHSVRLDNRGGIRQHHAWLAFRKGMKYGFRIWTKSETKQSLRRLLMDARHMFGRTDSCRWINDLRSGRHSGNDCCLTRTARIMMRLASTNTLRSAAN